MESEEPFQCHTNRRSDPKPRYPEGGSGRVESKTTKTPTLFQGLTPMQKRTFRGGRALEDEGMQNIGQSKPRLQGQAAVKTVLV